MVGARCVLYGILIRRPMLFSACNRMGLGTWLPIYYTSGERVIVGETWEEARFDGLCLPYKSA